MIKGDRAIQQTAWLLACLLIILAMLGCGRKAPPVPLVAKGNKIASPTNLKYTADDTNLVLTWHHEVDAETAKIEPDAFEVFLARKTFEACEGCPFKFESVTIVPMPDMTYSMPVEKGYQYYFRIQAVSEDNIRSDYSKTILYENK